MSPPETQVLFRQLLRPPVLHILRAAGFTRARPAVLETVIDLTSRYLTVLAYQTALHARHRQPDFSPDSFSAKESPLPAPIITITDVRMALQDVGALYPGVSELEEPLRNGGKGEEDLRGVESFIAWCQGDLNAEIRRVAGMLINAEVDLATAAAATGATTTNAHAATAKSAAATMTGGVADPTGLGLNSTVAVATAGTEHESPSQAPDGSALSNLPEDYLTILKKKHSKTGEESRWAGTALGKEACLSTTGEKKEEDLSIEGWDGVPSLHSWRGWIRENKLGQLKHGAGRDGLTDDGMNAIHGGEGGRSGTSSPLSDIADSGIGSGEDGFG